MNSLTRRKPNQAVQKAAHNMAWSKCATNISRVDSETGKGEPEGCTKPCATQNAVKRRCPDRWDWRVDGAGQAKVKEMVHTLLEDSEFRLCSS